MVSFVIRDIDYWLYQVNIIGDILGKKISNCSTKSSYFQGSLDVKIVSEHNKNLRPKFELLRGVFLKIKQT